MEQKNKIRLVIELNDADHAQLKIRAACKRVTLKKYVLDALENEYAREGNAEN